MEKLLQILSELRPEINFSEQQALIDDHILDSFDIVTLVGELNDTFEIEIGVEDLVPSNFNSVAAMFRLIKDLQNC
jgi:D-alanine--poly(phosphoribitol) ligase subunit 2